ncbi:MAG: 30S ribosomal protein S5 [Calditrichae bacterium]|nr:30S ribosomal protein S5 [Calditrichota bacterium]MCB9059784.1 30S ribosomal protein S5 [Calditrichia bacterium]
MLERINPGEIELKEKVVYINRVAKVLKGGRRFSFSAIVVVGDGNGIIGLGLGKAGEVINAISKATDQAKKNLVRVSLLDGTIPYPVNAKFGAAKVMLKPASQGTGVIAGGPVRAICEMAGVQNILTKSNGSSNPHNLSKATFLALRDMLSAEVVAQRRGLTINQLFHG